MPIAMTVPMDSLRTERKVAALFILLAAGSLLSGLLFGVIGAGQYIFPDLLKTSLSFSKSRPLHVYLVINWIFSAAAGGIYYYLPWLSNGRKLFSPALAFLHFGLQLFVWIVVVTGFFGGVFGGREYLEFPVWINAVVLISWLCFMINFFATVRPVYKTAPVYIWSFSTGLIFFFITMTEAQLWVFPFFNNNIIRDVTVQWKAMGSMVGSWNMLVYGSAMLIMEKISGDTAMNRSKLAFFFYFLGMTNLMFNWGHHTYIVPASPVVKSVSYFISMTELLILGNIIYTWRKKFRDSLGFRKFLPASVLGWADGWIFLNLVLSICISVPAINFYTHGTHITVAHAMGATIGINTMLLLASLVFIVSKENNARLERSGAWLKSALRVMNISLLVFWITLIGMGLVKLLALQEHELFYGVMGKLKPWFDFFFLSGITLLAGLAWVLVWLLPVIWRMLVPAKKD